jgi:hypothetical protein
MQIKYTGAFTARQWGAYTFDAAGGYVCDVADLATIQEMLASPHDDFAVAETDPLAQLIGAPAAAEMTLSGITSVDAYTQRPRAQKFFREERGHETEIVSSSN